MEITDWSNNEHGSILQTSMSVKMHLCVRTDDVSTLLGRLNAIVTLDTDTNRTQTRVKVLCSLLEDSTTTKSLFYLGNFICVWTSMKRKPSLYHNVTHVTFIQRWTSVRLAAIAVQGMQDVRIPKAATNAPVLEATVLI